MATTNWVIGLMSGTSLDGIDAALLKTDGEQIEAFGPWLTLAYDDDFRAQLRQATFESKASPALIADLTHRHALAVKALLEKAEMTAEQVALIGFHGQSIGHNPAQGWTLQVGNAAQLVEETGIAVVADFRSADVAAGGQGAPLVPLYHAALAYHFDVPLPAVFLNIGGIANVTWVGTKNALKPTAIAEDILAMDVGAGNVLLNDWMNRHTGAAMDAQGAEAAKGSANYTIVQQLLNDPFFAQKPPKSLDRNAFSLAPLEGLSVEDGAATLVAFTAAGVAKAAEHFPVDAAVWYGCGGGVHNPTLMRAMQGNLNHAELKTVEALGVTPDALEAQAFAFLAARQQRNLPLSLPSTTAARHAVVGGAFYPRGTCGGS